jgi:hypothetical protein
MAWTEEQLREAARKAYAAGDVAAAEELFRAAQALPGSTASTLAAPSQQLGPRMSMAPSGAALGPATPAFADGDARNAVAEVPPPAPDETLLESIMGPGWGRSLQVGLQGVGRGAADFVGMVGDISTGTANLGIAGVDTLAEMIAGEDAPDALDFRFGPSPVGSDAIANAATGVAESMGVDVIDKEDMSTWEKLGHSAARFGTQGLAGGAAIMRAAPGVIAAGQGPGATSWQRMLASVAEPYRLAPGRTLVGDAAAGAGAGIGVEAVDQNVSDEAWYKPGLTGLAALMGGFTGATAAQGVVEGIPAVAKGLVRSAPGMGSDFNLPLPKDGSGPVSKRVADWTARILQQQAVNAPKAAQTLGDNLASFADPNAPKPSPMAMTEDLGLRRLDSNYRNDLNLGPKMEAQDESARDYATERLLSILDEGADQAGTLNTIRARPGEIKAERDAAALPLLREAEASGVTVNAQPVADMLDAAMVGPKRPEVLRALKAARDALNVPGGDTLDTSVKGLYESRKAISDLIDGRSDSNTGKFAQAELIEAKKALDAAIIEAEPRFGEYLDEFKAGSRPLDVFEGTAAQRLVNTETDLRNVASRILSPGRYGTEKEMSDVMAMIGDNPEAQRGWRAAVADVLVARTTKNRGGEDLRPDQIATVYNQHRDTLAKIFSPEDMQALDEVHQILKLMSQPKASALAPDLRGTAVVDPRSAVQAALLASGRDMITTTMVMSRLNFVAKLLGADQLTMPYKINEVLMKIQTDPDLALAILKRPVSEGTGQNWSRDVQKLFAGSAAARDMAAPDEDEEMTNTIMDGFGRDAYGRPLPAPEVGGP